MSIAAQGLRDGVLRRRYYRCHLGAIEFFPAAILTEEHGHAPLGGGPIVGRTASSPMIASTRNLGVAKLYHRPAPSRSPEGCVLYEISAIPLLNIVEKGWPANHYGFIGCGPAGVGVVKRIDEGRPIHDRGTHDLLEHTIRGTGLLAAGEVPGQVQKARAVPITDGTHRQVPRDGRGAGRTYVMKLPAGAYLFYIVKGPGRRTLGPWAT
jgi:hypothetical protein